MNWEVERERGGWGSGGGVYPVRWTCVLFLVRKQKQCKATFPFFRLNREPGQPDEAQADQRLRGSRGPFCEIFSCLVSHSRRLSF